MTKISAITIAASAGLAAAGSLDLDRGYAADLRSDAGAYSVLNSSAVNLTVSAGIRFGYNANFRDNDTLGDNDTTIGFGFQEAEVRLSGQVTDSITATISFDFGPNDLGANSAFENGGTGTLEDAYADWVINDGFTLRIGQFVQSFSAGASMSEFHMNNVFRSSVETALAYYGQQQGVEARFGGDTWSGSVGFNDGGNAWGTGVSSSNSAFNATNEMDYAFVARFDIYSDSDKARFADDSSWRGSVNGWRAGAGVSYASRGDTNPVIANVAGDYLNFTVDGAYEGDGWAINAAFFGTEIDRDNFGDASTYGFEVGGSMFFSDRLEGFARYDVLIVDNDNWPDPLDQDYHILSAGLNHYLVPESHVAKLTAEIGYAFDDTRTLGGGQIYGQNGGLLRDSDEGEFTLSLMAQFLF